MGLHPRYSADCQLRITLSVMTTHPNKYTISVDLLLQQLLTRKLLNEDTICHR